MSKRLTQTEFAAIVGVQAASISLLCKRGVLDLKKGREQCIIDYCQNLRDRLQGRATGGTYDLMAERARLSHHQANIEGLKELERRGELVSAHAVALTWQNLIGAARAKLIGMPAKLAPVLLGAIDLHDIEGKLREEIYDALDELAGNGLPPDVEERLHAIERGMAKSADADLEPVGRKKPKAVGRR